MVRLSTTNDSKKINQHLGALVKQYRLEADLTQAQLGDFIGVTFQQIQKYERGDNQLSVIVFFVLCDVLDIPPRAYCFLFPHHDSAMANTISEFLGFPPRKQRAALSVARLMQSK